jgi:hypothetical protein
MDPALTVIVSETTEKVNTGATGTTVTVNEVEALPLIFVPVTVYVIAGAI